jgi:NADPH-dependent 2,4-dienoyl-CoA reductase/sulfur reductase-like enzyme
VASPHYLIIGNGAAGLSAAEIIRRRDATGRITILSNESHLFYSRPGIAYLVNGQVSAAQLISRTRAFYEEHRFELRQATVTGIDPARQCVFLQNGSGAGVQLGYDVLLLATGASAVPPPFPGGDLDGVLTFDTLDDANRVIRYGRSARSAVVVGGGITAMELAEGFRRQGAKTHLLQRGDRLWPRLFDERESAILEQEVRHEGIELHYREEIAEVLGRQGKVAGVRLSSGRELPCQVVGAAIGVRPNLGLVHELELAQDKGVLVNDYLQSTVATLFAAGDVAQVYDRWTGSHQLDVLWPSAINEGRAAGYNMVDVAQGRAPSYAYEKGSPFNAALLFGAHLTVIGRVGQQAGRDDGEDAAEISYMSRGSSNVWTVPFSSSYRSAWDRKGTDSLRVVTAGGKVAGALILGNQELADPLRQLIEYEIELPGLEVGLQSGQDNLPQTILQAWQQWRQGRLRA